MLGHRDVLWCQYRGCPKWGNVNPYPNTQECHSFEKQPCVNVACTIPKQPVLLLQPEKVIMSIPTSSIGSFLTSDFNFKVCSSTSPKVGTAPNPDKVGKEKL